MNEQHFEFVIKPLAMGFCLYFGSINTDHHIPEPPFLREFGAARGSPRKGPEIRGFELGKRKHIGGFVLPAPVAIEPLDMRIIRK